MSNKSKVYFQCCNCSYTSPKWLGRCPICQEWNSFVNKTTAINTEQTTSLTQHSHHDPILLKEIKTNETNRITSGIEEWDRVTGGGLLPGSFSILTGDPGIGKSTLLLQIGSKIALKRKVIYFSTEESLHQIKTRAERLNISSTKMLFSDQTTLENIIQTTEKIKPDVIFIDSIQSCYISTQTTTLPGTIAQLREASYKLLQFAKEKRITTLITGHITKDGQMAGPKLLEHMVDAVFYLQREDFWQTRILRSIKNRFGAINEVGFFDMGTKGLEEIGNINGRLIEQTDNSPGSIIICSKEGSRPLLIELQALCVTSKYGIPQRIVTGTDPKRITLIAAILEKYLHIKFSSQDIFFKISGGPKIKESSSDLGIALAMLSSFFNQPLPPKSLAIGELSLTGQVKAANQMDQRIEEAIKFGFKTLLIPQLSLTTSQKTGFSFIQLKNVYELLKLFPTEENPQVVRI